MSESKDEEKCHWSPKGPSQHEFNRYHRRRWKVKSKPTHRNSSNTFNHGTRQKRDRTPNSKGKWVIKSKPKSPSNIDTAREYNRSSATILYCGPDAKCTSDIVQIKRNGVIPLQPKDCIRIIAMGCTHELHRHVYIPKGDLLIHAGDVCNWRRYSHSQKVFASPLSIWNDMVNLLVEHRMKSPGHFRFGMAVIAGNHDLFAQHNTDQIRSMLQQNDIRFLVNDCHSIDIADDRSLRIFGSPVSWYRNKPSCAYQLHRKQHSDLWRRDGRDSRWKQWDNEFIDRHFPQFPVDIVVTHGPPAGYGDCEEVGRCTGSYALLRYIHKNRPKLFICCDYHGGGGANDSHGYGIHFLRFNGSSENMKDCCIVMNVAIAHQPARLMREGNMCRGVTIVDAKIDDFTKCNKT